jgi:hypothetical protein
MLQTARGVQIQRAKQNILHSEHVALPSAGMVERGGGLKHPARQVFVRECQGRLQSLGERGPWCALEITRRVPCGGAADLNMFSTSSV